jgi:lysophospholipase L1-like esterase
MKKVIINLCIIVTAFPLFLYSACAALLKLACIGDSITFGAGVEDREENSYPAQLQNLLGSGYKVSNCGTSGIQMRNYLKRWGDKITAIQPDIVTIKLGTNDTHHCNFNQPGNKEAFDEDYRNATLERKRPKILPLS